MFTINTLRENRARAWEACKNYLDTHRTENGTLSAEDNAAYERMEAEVVALGNEIKRMERASTLDAELARTVGSPLTNVPGSAAQAATGRASDEYKAAMLTALRDTLAELGLPPCPALLAGACGAALISACGFGTLVNVVYPLLGWMCAFALVSLLFYLPAGRGRGGPEG